MSLPSGADLLSTAHRYGEASGKRLPFACWINLRRCASSYSWLDSVEFWREGRAGVHPDPARSPAGDPLRVPRLRGLEVRDPDFISYLDLSADPTLMRPERDCVPQCGISRSNFDCRAGRGTSGRVGLTGTPGLLRWTKRQSKRFGVFLVLREGTLCTIAPRVPKAQAKVGGC